MKIITQVWENNGHMQTPHGEVMELIELQNHCRTNAERECDRSPLIFKAKLVAPWRSVCRKQPIGSHGVCVPRWLRCLSFTPTSTGRVCSSRRLSPTTTPSTMSRPGHLTSSQEGMIPAPSPTPSSDPHDPFATSGPSRRYESNNNGDSYPRETYLPDTTPPGFVADDRYYDKEGTYDYSSSNPILLALPFKLNHFCRSSGYRLRGRCIQQQPVCTVCRITRRTSHGYRVLDPYLRRL